MRLRVKPDGIGDGDCDDDSDDHGYDDGDSDGDVRTPLPFDEHAR